jgi:hypothetical protein
MIKKLITAGCSYTAGAHTDRNRQDEQTVELEKKNSHWTFGRYLAELGNIPFYNLAKAGSSFEAIMFQVTQWIYHIGIQDTLLLIGLTHTCRQNYFHPIKQLNVRTDEKSYSYKEPWMLGKPNNIENEWGPVLEGLFGSKDNYSTYITHFWRDILQPNEAKFLDVQRMVTLEGYLKSINANYMFINIPGETNLIEEGDKWEDYLDNVYQFKDDSKCWKAYIQNKYTEYNYGHPIRTDHKEFAEMLYSEKFSQQFSQDS